MKKLSLLTGLFSFLIFIGIASATTYTCDSCASCTAQIASSREGDTIRLNTSILNNAATCIDFAGNDGVTFDCQGNLIDGTGSNYGISLPTGSNNNTIQNCRVQEFGWGVRTFFSWYNTFLNDSLSGVQQGMNLHDSNRNSILNSTISYLRLDNASNNTFAYVNVNGIILESAEACPNDYNYFTNVNSSYTSYGVIIFCGSYNVFTKSTFIGNSFGFRSWGSYGNVINDSIFQGNGQGLYFRFGNTYSTILNNFFNDSTEGWDGTAIYNLTKNCSKRNIINGTCIGGNFWSGYTGKDLNGDGIGETLIPYNYDYLPLTNQLGITFIDQSPADINSLNIFGHVVNITYNIAFVPNSSKVYYKTNTSTSDCWIWINGIKSICGWLNTSVNSNVSDNYTYALYDNQVYPTIYNYDEYPLEQTPHSVYTFTGHSSYVKIRFYNVSSIKQYSIFEVMANDSTALTTLGIFYCNSSYTTGDPDLSSNCVKFYDLLGNVPYKHTHSIHSSHMLIPFAIDNVTGLVNELVMATPLSYFLLQGNTSAWHAYYIANDTGSAQITTDNGTTWTNLTGTVDAHLHQYDGTDSLWYYIQTCDNSGNCGNSSVRQDLLQTGGLPPTAPDVTVSPLSMLQGNTLSITYTAAVSPNAYAIASYRIFVTDANRIPLNNLTLNNSPSLSYSYVPERGSFRIAVEDCDTIGQCSTGFSDVFTTQGLLTYNLGIMGVAIALVMGAGVLLFLIGGLFENFDWSDRKSMENLLVILIGAIIFIAIIATIV